MEGVLLSDSSGDVVAAGGLDLSDVDDAMDGVLLSDSSEDIVAAGQLDVSDVDDDMDGVLLTDSSEDIIGEAAGGAGGSRVRKQQLGRGSNTQKSVEQYLSELNLDKYAKRKLKRALERDKKKAENEETSHDALKKAWDKTRLRQGNRVGDDVEMHHGNAWSYEATIKYAMETIGRNEILNEAA